MNAIYEYLPTRGWRAAVVAWSALCAVAVVSAADEPLRANERTFLEKALTSTQQQLRLADIGANQATSSDLRSHAMQLTTDYRDLVDALDALIRRKGGLAGAPVGGTSETYQKLRAQTGAEFDREFVRLEGELSDSIMALFERAANNARDLEVREFASAQIPLLRDHQNRSAELRKTFE